jgi:hypothetical protein
MIGPAFFKAAFSLISQHADAFGSRSETAKGRPYTQMHQNRLKAQELGNERKGTALGAR